MDGSDRFMTTEYQIVPRFSMMRAVHATLAAVLVLLGAILILPDDTYATSGAWRLFAVWGIPEPCLGCLLTLTGAISLIPFWRPGLLLMTRPRAIVALALVHMTLAIVFFLGNVRGGAVVPYSGLAFLALYSVYREALEHGSRR